MDEEKTLRLLIVDPSLTDAEALASVLRNAGKAVRPNRLDTDEELVQFLEKNALDLILYDADQEALPPSRMGEVIGQSGRDVPVIAVTKEYGEDAVSDILDAGLSDLVGKEDGRHLRLAVERELNALRTRRNLRRTEQALRESEKRCDALLDSSRDAIAYIHDGMHVYANRAYLELFGYDEFEEIEGTPIMDMVAPDNHAKLKEYLRSYATGQEASSHEMEISGRRNDGTTFAASMEFLPASIEEEACTQVIIRRQMSTELESQIQYLSQQDLVTGLYNRQYFMEQLETVVSDAVNGRSNSALLYIAVDGFRSIKDSVGMSGADLVLSDLAELIQNELDDNETAARFGDSSFTVLTADWDSQRVQSLAERIRAAVESHIAEVNGQSVPTTCSIGICPVTDSAPSGAEVLSRADLACEMAHDGGGNSVHLHNPVADERASKARDEDWIRKIQAALEEDRYKLVYQPIASLHGDSEDKYEVLLRMYDETNEIVEPSKFLPIAEEHGLMDQIDRWVIGHTLRIITERRQMGHDTTCFVKISSQSLGDPELLPWIAEQLKTHRIPGNSLALEIAESTAVTRLKEAKAFAKGLQQIHCSFALEHFGNGVNSFHTLKHLQADFVKIDGSFTRGLANDPENQATIKSITETAHSMNKLVIAEFVEDANSLAVLWQAGVNYIQGNFLQEPTDVMTFDFVGETN